MLHGPAAARASNARGPAPCRPRTPAMGRRLPPVAAGRARGPLGPASGPDGLAVERPAGAVGGELPGAVPGLPGRLLERPCLLHLCKARPSGDRNHILGPTSSLSSLVLPILPGYHRAFTYPRSSLMVANLRPSTRGSSLIQGLEVRPQQQTGGPIPGDGMVG